MQALSVKSCWDRMTSSAVLAAISGGCCIALWLSAFSLQASAGQGPGHDCKPLARSIEQYARVQGSGEPMPACESVPQTHSHNDYEHTYPLFDAMSWGFVSVESDIWL
jgi:hypothetical protein